MKSESPNPRYERLAQETAQAVERFNAAIAFHTNRKDHSAFSVELNDATAIINALTDAQTRVEEQEQKINQLSHHIQHVHNGDMVLQLEKEQLKSKVAELKKDKARLDWLENNHTLIDFRHGAFQVYNEEPPRLFNSTREKLRSAIDTAMRKGQE